LQLILLLGAYSDLLDWPEFNSKHFSEALQSSTVFVPAEKNLTFFQFLQFALE
jgi:hypothetical protein